MRHDIVADMFCSIKNAEFIGSKVCTTPVSKLIKSLLLIMQKRGYIGEFEYVESSSGGHFRIALIGKINDCGAIKPRYSVASGEFIKWEKRFLPASSLGLLAVSTSQGVMSHTEAKEKGIGGKLIGYVY
jgi:small subunit ribosomal protein S8